MALAVADVEVRAVNAAELERRKPVWDAMSDLFLDAETRWAIPRVALVLTRSGYSEEELDAIWHREIVPECAWNLRQPAGEWALFVLDEEALAARAVGQTPPATRGSGETAPDFLDGRWRAIKDLSATLLALPPDQRAARTAMWTAFVHAYLATSLETLHGLEAHLETLRATGASEDALVAAFQEVRPVFGSLLVGAEVGDEERRARDVRVAIGLAIHAAAL